MHSPLVITGQPPLPGNAQHTLLVDSTRGLRETVTAGAAAQVPGSIRARWAGKRVECSILPTGQAVTVFLECLTDSSGTTAAAFEIDTTAELNGTIPIAAGTTKQISWLPRTPDFRIRILAGATGPTTLVTTCQLVCDRTAGVS